MGRAGTKEDSHNVILQECTDLQAEKCENHWVLDFETSMGQMLKDAGQKTPTYYEFMVLPGSLSLIHI